jgi:hypothetical protein
VYERLCGEGLLEMRHGQGTFATGRMSKARMAAHRARLIDELRQITRQATGLVLTIDELHELLSEAAAGAEKLEASATNGEAPSGMVLQLNCNQFANRFDRLVCSMA